MKKTVSLGLLLISVIVAAGCADIVADPAVGTWENSQLHVMWVYHADGTIDVSSGGSNGSGYWTNLGDGKYAIRSTPNGNLVDAHFCQISADGKTMTTEMGTARVVCTKVS